MYIYMFIYLYICLCTYTYVCAGMFILCHIQTIFVNIYIYTYTYTVFIHMYIYIYMCVYDEYTFCVYILLRLLMNVMFTTHHWYYSRLIVYIYIIYVHVSKYATYIYIHT